jgi:hypothetical protein
MSALRALLTLSLGACFATAVRGEDITVPLHDGNILIRADFIRKNQFGVYVPELALKITNQTSSSWRTLKLQFEMGGLCNGEPRQWTVPVTTSLGWAEDHEIAKEYTDTVIPLFGKVDGCKTEIIKARLVLAENSKTRIDGVTGETTDLEKELQKLKTERDAEAAAQAEEDRKSAEAQAKKDAADAARRKRVAAEKKKRDAELSVRMAKEKAEEQAKAAEEQRKIRDRCAAIYQNTADKKLKDLTVREEQQVRACQALGLYPPQP